MVKTKQKVKTILKTALAVLVLAICIATGYSYVAFNYYRPSMADIPIDDDNLHYFQESYEACRKAFVDKAINAQRQNPSVQLFSVHVPSPTDTALAIDFCHVPPRKPSKKLLILTSGVHGIEGYAGSALQQMVLAELLNHPNSQGMGILLVHGMNPFGFKHTRRVTEHNIDLNRNCYHELDHLSLGNQGYNKLYHMLNPVGKANPHSLRNRFFVWVAIEKIVRESMPALRQAILQGQYEHPAGLYFGGKELEPQVNAFTKVLRDAATGYDTLFCIDLHTVFGQRGTLHLFPNPMDNADTQSHLERLFAGRPIDWGDTKDFYTIHGSFIDYVGKIMPDKYYLPMLFEYGTMNSQSTMGSIASLHRMILENQGHQHGYRSTTDSVAVKGRFREMYFPSSPQWRSKAVADTRQLLTEVMGRYGKGE